MKTIDKIPNLTKDQIAQSAIKELQARGARVRKVFNGSAYKKRRYQVQKGWGDVSGYSASGVHLECECKTKNDKLRPEQIERLEDLDKCGGISLVAVQKGIAVELIPWKEAKMIYL